MYQYMFVIALFPIHNRRNPLYEPSLRESNGSIIRSVYLQAYETFNIFIFLVKNLI